MTTAQMNIRIDDALKNRGDAVFRRYGVTPSDAVRALWNYTAEHEELPEFIDSHATDAAQEKLRLSVRESSGMATRLLEEMTGIATIPEDRDDDDVLFEEYMGRIDRHE